MTDQRAQYAQLQRTITDEFFRIANIPSWGLIRTLLRGLLWLPTRRFAKYALDLDNQIAQHGLAATSRQFLNQYTHGYRTSGAENILQEGPLILTANHPGTFDLFTIMADIPRDDVKIIISGVPVVRSLEGIAKYLIYTTSDPHGRMNVVRAATRHVKNGGCLMLFPTGILDPDPEIMPGASEAIGKWSRSVELVLRRVPEAKVVVAIVSGVLPPAALRNPFTHLVKEQWKKQRLAEFMLIAQHLVINKQFDLEPKVSYSHYMAVEDLIKGNGELSLTEGIIRQARAQLGVHTQIFPGYGVPG